MMHTITKVVTRNFFVDFYASIQNMFGCNLTGYEKMSNNAMTQIKNDLKEKKIKLKWFRFEITQLTNGALMVILYGES